MFLGLAMSLVAKLKSTFIPPSTSQLLIEDGTDALLIENNDNLMLEA